MKLSSRMPGPAAGTLTKPKASPSRISFLPLLVLLMVTSTVMAGLACKKDADCRRSLCIFEQCKPPPSTGGVCQVNSHCLKAPTEVCIDSKCSAKSNSGGYCDEDADCASVGDKCSAGQTCFTPFDPSKMKWEGNKAITKPRYQSAGVAVGDALFVVAGLDPLTGSTTNSVVKYNSLTNTWQSKAPASVGVFGHSVVAVGQFVFLIGGFDGTKNTKTFFSYDTVNDQWDETWNQLPKSISGAAAAVVGTTIYLFGGQDGITSSFNTILSLDTSNKQNQWIESSTAFLAASNSLLSATVVGSDIYLIGGSTSNVASKKVYKYNTLEPGKSPVDTGKDMLQARLYHLSFYDSDNQRLYVVGGTSANFQDVVEYLNLGDSSAIWTSINDPNYVLILSRAGGLIGSKFYLTATVNTPPALQVLDISDPQKVVWSPFPNSPNPTATIFQLTGPSEVTSLDAGARSVAFYDINSKSWTAGTPSQQLPLSRPFAASAVSKGVLHVMGGEEGSGPSSDVFYFDRTNGWTASSKSLPDGGTTRACAAVSDTQMFLYGGLFPSDEVPQNSLFVSNLDASGRSTTWTKIDNNLSSTQPTGVNHCAAVVANGKLLIFGGGRSGVGYSTTGLIQSFDISSGKWDSPHSSSITPRSFLSAVLLKDYVFIIGGTSDGQASGALNKVEVFDTKAPFSSSTAVTSINDMPTPRFNLGSVTDGSSIFSFGGGTVAGIFPSLEKLRAP